MGMGMQIQVQSLQLWQPWKSST